MGFNFPNAPTLGQKFPSPSITGQPVWQWDGSAWKALGAPGLGGIYVSDTAPAGAPDNSLWWESDTGNLYIRYNDGDSSQWVIVVPSTALAGIVRFDTAQGLTETQMVQGRSNLYATPFDALAYSGIQFNGSTEVSQEKGTGQTSFGPTATAGYICDGWNGYGNGSTGVISGGQGPGTGMPTGFLSRISITVTTAQASMAATDRYNLSQNIEGYRISRLGWGTTTGAYPPQPLTIAFWIRNTPAGIYSLAIRNGASVNRSYVTTYTQNVSDTWEYKTITIPADTSGTWATDNTNAMTLTWSLSAGSTYTTSTLNAWQAGNFLAATTQTNMMASISNGLRITGLVVLPGIEAPSAARSPLIMRPYDQELLTCKRYLLMRGFNANQLIGTFQAFNVGGANGQLFTLSPAMRIAPTVTISAAGHFTLQGSGGGGAACTTFSPGAQVDAVWATFGGSSGLTVGNATTVFANTTGAWIMCDARL